MSGPGDPFTYNTIEVPTVVGLLHNILSQYPDNGQIIKELVQNAEDAGASRVEVIHVASPLTHPGAEQVVQRFLQGPAIYVYNDAVFTEEDWHGIRKLSDSIKKSNPLKVGQFGLGFKSVFHLTDYVTIISGQQVLFMDPSEPEAKMCRSLSLKKLSEMLPESACQRSFERHLAPHHLAQGTFPATLFWFPLRQHSSRISDTIYTPSHVERLFGSFAVEANICLTFLKSLEEITLSKAEGDRVTHTHCMKITSPALEEVRNKRKSFRKCLQQCEGSPPSALTCYYEATLQTSMGEGNSQEQTMRILHLLPGKDDPEWMKWGGRNNSKHIPLVGVAVPVSPPAASEAKGHIFSFLPLPPDPSNQTSLPIQVNGAFILSQNRRQVKWRTSESSNQEPDVLWNEDLVIKVVTKAYQELLKKLLEEAKEGTISTGTWYTFLPNLKITKGRWKHMAEKVWHSLLPLPVIASEVRGFLMPREVLTSNNLAGWKEEIVKTVKKVLCDQKLPLASLPDHVQASINILGQQLSPVTPQLLRSTLRGMCDHLDGVLSHQHLLCYAVDDKQYQDLCGLPLLPLQNQMWTSYSSNGTVVPVVYLCTEKETGALLGLEEQVASIQVANHVRKILQDVAQSGKTQLCKFQPQKHGPDLLFRSATYVQQCQPSEQQVGRWLSQVWDILQHLTLNSVKHIPLLPTSHPPCAASLACLSSPVVVQEKGCWLSEPQVKALALLGVVVVPPLPTSIRHIELQGYLYSSDRHGTTQALSKVVSQVSDSTAFQFNTHRTEEERQALISLIETHSIQPSLKDLLTKLTLFEAQDEHNSIKYVSLECVNAIAPEHKDFPVSYPETLLKPSQHQEHALALALGAHQLSKEAVCVKALQSNYSDECVSMLVRYIMRDANLVRSSTVLSLLRNTRFVPNVAGSLCRASELYDPEDQDHDILIGETQMPDDSFRGHYTLLRSLGLKKVHDMPQTDLISLIKCQKNILLSEVNKVRKSVGLLKAVNRRHDCPQVCQAVKGVPFVYGVLDQPGGYPSSLKWATPSGPLQPQGLKSIQYSGVLGSAVALVKCCDVPVVAAAFGWTETPAVEIVIQHLRNMMAAYQAPERGKYFALIKQTYHQLSAALDSGAARQLAALRAEPCVFTEHGFRTPDKVYIRPGTEDLQLLPYLHALPFELRESERLFQCLGCAVQQSPPLLLAVLEGVRVQHQGGDSISSAVVERDQRLVVLVLERLQHHLEELPGPLLVPVKTLDGTLELVEVEHSAYTEAATEWIDSNELGVKVVHECVSARLASALGVAPLQSFLSIGGEAVMEWGQQEPLTTRLHNLLEQYRDGVSVLKELVQNADDAEATSVCLLYDERQNEDARKLLLGTQMGKCQGPALWVYNDALFSQQDFSNLRELGAGTKLLQPTKIGKFGLGFCSVYNLTDVPSLVSGSSYVVLDPHMTHLSSNSPGLRFNFTDSRNSYMLRTLRDQFQPFTGVFGCDLQGNGSLEGTLFRLPFRTTASKISDTCYSRRDMMQLLKMFSAVVGQLLLFTQHVSSISVFHLRATATAPSEMVELFRASREKCQPVPISGLTFSATSGAQSLLKKAAALFSTQQQELKWNGELLQEKSTTKVNVQYFRSSTELCGLEEGKWNTTWITSWHSGSGSACKLAETLRGKALPLAAVAVPVRESSSGWQPQCLADLPPGFYHEGHFHCFLPLPVKTLLPVQINGVLEVASDRTSLLTQTEDDRRVLSWNATLLGDAAVNAHLGLAEALRHLGLSAEIPYHAIWPVVDPAAEPLVSTITKGFYRALEQEGLELFRCSGGDWHPLARCRFLEEDFLQVPKVGDIAFEFLGTYLNSFSELRLVRLPKHVQACFNKDMLSQHMVTQETFFREYFIPHLREGIISPDKRDQLTLHLLDSEHSCLKLLQLLSCIPTQPIGTLRPPAELVNPKTRIARLFSPDDERFPVDKFLSSNVRSTTLEELGMNSHSLPVELVVERAMTVTDLECPQCAYYRVEELLYYITHEVGDQEKLAGELKSVPFLPIMPKPDGWSVAWHGECLTKESKESECCSHHRNAIVRNLVFDCPPALCLSSFMSLVASSHLLLEDTIKTPKEVLEKLGVTVCALNLPLQSVMEQLCVYSAASEDVNLSMCHTVYEHLEDCITHVRRGRTFASCNMEKLGTLREKRILITRHGFKEPKLFAGKSEIDCAPDLFSVRTEGLDKYQNLMDIWGMKDNYNYEVVLKVIQGKRETFGNNRLSEDDISQVSKLLSVLYKVRQSDVLSEQVLYLPDTEGYLRPTQDLCFDDGAELSSGRFICLHRSISVSQDMCKWLSIKSKTRKRLIESSSRLHFGQSEPLTTRLRNILEEYPCDSGIMKELLQNADDAGATEVAFIKDFRHLPTEKLFDPKWAPIQGPALSFFNNRGFTEKDLRSIQDLGNSSKKEDPATTGQYGIGFNAVYHLTDAPSFLTRGPQVPQGETLCMFDPHCWYDPHASPEFPGVQFVNLNDLRKDHSESFIGYLEEELSDEGTMFRLPLRTATDSLIVPKKIMTEEDIEVMMTEFQGKMPQCLLFLKNVRKISIKKVQKDGGCKEEYCVEASVSEECHLPVLSRKYGDAHAVRDPCNVDMVRTSYRMKINCTLGSSSEWLVIQQQGVEKKDSLPDIVRNAFSNKILNLLPHGGVAVLLTNAAYKRDVHSTSCYLPLPIRSGLPFSINGHFALSSSRRDLWKGPCDAKSLWNEWLMKELIVPAAVHAVEQFRTLIFPSEREDCITEHIYQNKVREFHKVLPLVGNANSEEWKDFVKWFYEQVRDTEVPFFDSFIPETDLQPPAPQYLKVPFMPPPARKSRKGCLRWHGFHAHGHEFSVYFSTDLPGIADVFRRLGMKVSSEEMYKLLKEANLECPLLTPEVALAFLKSWNKDIHDNCIPKIGSKVADTPYLKSDNVLNVLKYIVKAKEFSSTSVDKLPLLLTNDSILGYFSVENPVFLSSFCGLLPAFGREFTFCDLVRVIEQNYANFKDVVKEFTPADLVERLPHVLDASYCIAGAKIPLTDQFCSWIERFWRFVVHFIEKNYKSEQEINWIQSKTCILATLGDWAFYPVRERNKDFLIPIKDSWQALDHSTGDLVFCRLPVPSPSYRLMKQPGRPSVNSHDPYVPSELQLAARLEDPVSVLKLLHFHRESITNFFRGICQGRQLPVQVEDILKYLGKHCQSYTLSWNQIYLGKHCQSYTLSRNQIRSLQIFKDSSGQLFDLLGRALIVVASSYLQLNTLSSLCDEMSLLIVLKPADDDVTRLYEYIEPNCILEELDLYAKIILPNISSLSEGERIYYLEKLSRNLPVGKTEEKWDESERQVVAALKRCSFIEVNGRLETADHFYDPYNPVYSVMGMNNLPDSWRDSKWRCLLRLAGMIDKVTPSKFMEFASSLSIRDKCVKEKSEVLCRYFNSHYKDFELRMSEILDIEFLVPKKCDELEKIFSHYKTNSGLVAFSKGANPDLAHVIWSTRSLLPKYAIECTSNLPKYCTKIHMNTPPVGDILEHIIKLCSSMQKEPEKSPEVIKGVMESIYDYLSKNNDDALKALKEREIPIIHIPNHNVFVPSNFVVENLEEEILPYLYKGPTFYGKFFDALKKFGMQDCVSSNSYAQVLKVIHNNSGQGRLHPGEVKSMKIALKGLTRFCHTLKDLTVSELYLPARDGTLRSSAEMYVADNMEYLEAVEKTLQEPVFVGFEALDIKFEECNFVNNLPQRLQPKFLSEACQESLCDGMEETDSGLLNEVKELLHAQDFRSGVLRVINHHKLQHGSVLSQQEREEILALLARVTVRQVTKISTTLTLHNKTVGQRLKLFFHQLDGKGDQQMLTVYISKKIPSSVLPTHLHQTYSLLLHKWNVELMCFFYLLFSSIGKPHDIHKHLDEVNVKAYSAVSPIYCLYRYDVGNYLEERFLPFLDNGFYKFSKGEIVCMKKYSCQDDQENSHNEDEDEYDIFVIVQVERLVEKHASCQMFDTYEVNTSHVQPCLVVVKAYQLFRFVRKENKDDVLAEASPTQEEAMSEKEIFRDIRRQLKEIWGVADEQERRHLLRRLQFKWHPDMNPDQVELCTRVMQYIQSLVGRLEREEQIPDEEDASEAPRTTPSETYSSFFRPPPRWYRHSSSFHPSFSNRNRRQERRPRSDLHEAQRWQRQAQSDLQAAERMAREAPSWTVFMCYQAAEKMLLATLFLQDMEEASRQKARGPLEHTLASLARPLAKPRVTQLASSIQDRAGGFLGPLYPTFNGCPCDHYREQDAHHLLGQTRELVYVLEEHFT